MTVRLRSAATLFSIATFALSAPVPVHAVQVRYNAAPCNDAPFLLITYVKVPDKHIADKANQSLRGSIDAKTSRKDLCIIAKDKMDAQLQASGFHTDEPISAVDAAALGGVLRADFSLQAGLAAKGTTFQFDGTLVLPRDIYYRETFTSADPGASMASAGDFFALKLKDVLKQMPHQEKCYNLRREGKFAEAEAEAKAGIASYPEAVISRLCLAATLQEGKKSPDDVLAVVKEVLKRDSLNIRALTQAYTAYDAKKDAAMFTHYASQVISLDPTNPQVEAIVDALIGYNKTAEALGILDRSLREDPDNKQLLNIQFRLIYAGNHFKDAAAKGEALAKLDSGVVEWDPLESTCRHASLSIL